MSTQENYLEFRGLQNILKMYIEYLSHIHGIYLYNSDLSSEDSTVGDITLRELIDGFLVDNQSEIHRFLAQVKKSNN